MWTLRCWQPHCSPKALDFGPGTDASTRRRSTWTSLLLQVSDISSEIGRSVQQALEFGAPGDAELLVDALHAVVDGADRELQLRGDLAVGPPGQSHQGGLVLGRGQLLA